MIGRYKLLQKIGEGGMGVVYMAEQTEPVVRKVALKIIKLGMDSRPVVARFEAERQALALMDHPNIAKVLDAGTTGPLGAPASLPAVGVGAANPPAGMPALPVGRPYFVMELVHGVPITEYCGKNKLTTKERLELFIPVCQAIQHAHQKGIIHRDIKPSNVMVTLHDDVPVPKVIDFGVAKATNQRLTEKTLFTHYAQMIGTPAYMSPEQAEMSGLDIDTRSDIYSLGVLLYELLTGTTPFDAKELLSKGYAEMQRIIAEQEPVKPSTRMSTLTDEQRTVVAKNRGMEAGALRRGMQGDLDWIVMKCLEKDRTRRYETSNGLAADLRRHLNNELIAARPPTTAYLLKKLIKRNKAAFATTVFVVTSLAVGFGVAAWSLSNEKRARKQAQSNFELARQVVDDSLAATASALSSTPHSDRIRRKLQEDVMKYYQAFMDQNLGNSDLRVDVAKAAFCLAKEYQLLGQFDQSQLINEKASSLYEEFVKQYPQNLGYRYGLYDCYGLSGANKGEMGLPFENLRYWEEQVAIAERIAHDFPKESWTLRWTPSSNH
jgi:serine/threonine protein kinase